MDRPIAGQVSMRLEDAHFRYQFLLEVKKGNGVGLDS